MTLANSRINAINSARQVLKEDPVFLDTETTGLEKTDEIVEISVIDDAGQILLESLVRPTQPIPTAATRIHGITNAMVQHAPFWPILWPTIRSILSDHPIVIYNSDFDMRLIQQTFKRHNRPFQNVFNTYDLLKVFAEFRGDWDSYHRAYRYYSLENAGQLCSIELPNSHRSTADTLLTRALLHFIADSSYQAGVNPISIK
jgi:DNA polymerase-3 subunit epsilon